MALLSNGFVFSMALVLAQASMSVAPGTKSLELSPAPLRGKSIVVDAGHGGYDSGATSGGAVEKNINLAIARLLRDALTKLGAQVSMTRETDVFIPLDDRNPSGRVATAVSTHANVLLSSLCPGFYGYALRSPGGGAYSTAIAAAYTAAVKQAFPDAFVSVHCNWSSSSSANGVELYYHTQASLALACSVYRSLIARTNAAGRWVMQKRFRVIKNSAMPAVLAETGYISNSHERNLLTSTAYQKLCAEALASGVVEFLTGRAPTSCDALPNDSDSQPRPRARAMKQNHHRRRHRRN
jgi:N-acetylmuramoyl-L-alanine amidase